MTETRRMQNMFQIVDISRNEIIYADKEFNNDLSHGNGMVEDRFQHNIESNEHTIRKSSAYSMVCRYERRAVEVSVKYDLYLVSMFECDFIYDRHMHLKPCITFKWGGCRATTKGKTHKIYFNKIEDAAKFAANWVQDKDCLSKPSYYYENKKEQHRIRYYTGGLLANPYSIGHKTNEQV